MPARKPCGKVCWPYNRARAIVLAAGWFRHDLRRQERHCYYCSPCRAWHTTSQ